MIKQKLNILLTTILLSVLFFTVISCASTVQGEQYDGRNAVITETTNSLKGTTEIKIESYGLEGASKFYLCSNTSGSKETYDGTTRTFKYDIELSSTYTKSSGALLESSSWKDDNGRLKEYDITGNTSPNNYFKLKDAADTSIAHDNLGNFYLLNKFYLSEGSIDGTDTNTKRVAKYELIPVGQDISFKIGDVSFSNLDEINSRGNFVLDPSNTYDAICADVRNTVKNNYSTNSGEDPIGVLQYDFIAQKLFLFCPHQSTSGELIYNFSSGSVSKSYVNGKVQYTMPVTIKYVEKKLSIYQDGDVSREYNYALTLPSKASGTLKIFYTNPGSNDTVSTTTVTVTNGKFQIPIQVGKVANFYVASAESIAGQIAVQAPDVAGTDVHWGNSGTVCASNGMTNALYQQYGTDFHNLLLAHIKEGNLTVNVLTTYLQNCEYGETSMLFFYNVERDGTIAISGINANINPIETITGNIELSDKTINFSSNNFNITNGKGTFTVKSNSKITLKSLPRVVTYKISNVKAETSTVSSVVNSEGGVGSTVEIKLQAPAATTYTITWKNWDGTTLKTQTVNKGVTPSYDGTPTRPSDSNYSYTFNGWSPTVVAATANATYTATYKSTPISSDPYYTITWKNWDGSVLKTDSVKKGTVPNYTGTTPTRPDNDTYTYTFKGWSPSVVAATTNTTYTAQFTATTKPTNPTYYTITWKNWDSSVLKTESVLKGVTPSYSGTPTRPDDSNYTYTFKGWSPAVTAASANVTYTAQYTATAKPSNPTYYTITWKNWDNSVLKTESVLKGVTPSYSGTPTRPDDSNYTYTFKGWSPAVSAANASATYTAQYKATPKTTTQKYTITWKNWDGSVLSTQSVEKGAMPSYSGTPTRPADSSYTYSFTGWSPAITAATANATYTAQYKSTPKPSTQTYTIIWKNWNGSVLKTQTVNKGTTPSYSGTPTRPADSNYTYTFKGWSPTVTAANANATYTAQYTAKAKTVSPKLSVSVKILTPKAAKKAFTAKWKKVSKANLKKIAGYQIQYSTNKNFISSRTIKAGKKATSKKIKGLKAKTYYYVRIRAYNGSKFGPWSTVRRIKTK